MGHGDLFIPGLGRKLRDTNKGGKEAVIVNKQESLGRVGRFILYVPKLTLANPVDFSISSPNSSVPIFRHRYMLLLS